LFPGDAEKSASGLMAWSLPSLSGLIQAMVVANRRDLPSFISEKVSVG
jgi:hypothetical protein